MFLSSFPIEIQKQIKDFIRWKFKNEQQLRAAVKEWNYQKNLAKIKYGNISHWDVENIKNMSYRSTISIRTYNST